VSFSEADSLHDMVYIFNIWHAICYFFSNKKNEGNTKQASFSSPVNEEKQNYLEIANINNKMFLQ